MTLNALLAISKSRALAEHEGADRTTRASNFLPFQSSVVWQSECFNSGAVSR